MATASRRWWALGLIALAQFMVAPEAGRGSAQTWLVLGGAALALGVFPAVQARRREPLVRLGIFRAPNLAWPPGSSTPATRSAQRSAWPP